jgi:hypothetical protein
MIDGRLRLATGATVVLLGIPFLGACESSQDKSARLEAQGAGLEAEKGVSVGRENPDVKVTGKTAITDENGTAIVVRLDSSSARDQVDLPVIFELTDASGEPVGDNSTPGIQRTLTHTTVVPARKESWWVNDQVVAAGEAKEIKVQVGSSETPVPRQVPDFKPTEPALKNDPIDGLVAVGKVSNPTSEEQRKVLVTIVASKGGKVVAAGRGIVAKVKPNKAARYSVFFIGDPKGAKLEVAATPTLFEGVPEGGEELEAQ